MSEKNQFPAKPDVEIMTIENGETVSDAIDLHGTTIAGLTLPAAFTGTTLTFQASYNGVDFVPIHDGISADFSITIVPDRYIPIDPSLFYGIRWLKIVSGSIEVSDRIIVINPYPI